MRVGGGSNRISFSKINESRRKKSIQMRKYREERRKRDKIHTQNAINRMQETANIFAIKTNASFDSIDRLIRAAQQRKIDAAVARSSQSTGNSGLGANVNKVA
ncbi:MAG: hypothetical protein HRU28_06415 [Rhizobiales bacterium]|nr:hypothetical protein [Hyphomicrobiales bacterium]